MNSACRARPGRISWSCRRSGGSRPPLRRRRARMQATRQITTRRAKATTGAREMDNLFSNPARMNALRARLLSFGDSDGKMAWDSFDYSPPDGLASLDFDVVDGTAVIPVNGALASAQIPYWYAMADLTYENLIAAVSEAANDGEVERILLRVNSPGGTVTGCAEAAALLDKLSEQVPIWAHCQMADSAAYWLASAANRNIVDPTGEAGSIGTIMTHMDMSKMLAEWGVDVTHIFSGDKKAAGSPC